MPPVIANVTGWLQENCLANMTPRQHYELQDLFSVYVHRAPGFKGADEKSLFYNRDIEDRCGTLLRHSSECGYFVCNTRLCFGVFPCHFLFGCKLQVRHTACMRFMHMHEAPDEKVFLVFCA